MPPRNKPAKITGYCVAKDAAPYGFGWLIVARVGIELKTVLGGFLTEPMAEQHFRRHFTPPVTHRGKKTRDDYDMDDYRFEL